MIRINIVYTLFLLLIIIIGTLLLLDNRVPTKDICAQCNILLIDIDTLRADDLPCYGYQKNTAPNLCAFAEKSVIFNDNYSTSYWTQPSIFSTITSLYPAFHRVEKIFDRLSPEIPTLAEVLHKNGYRTVYVNAVNNIIT